MSEVRHPVIGVLRVSEDAQIIAGYVCAVLMLILFYVLTRKSKR